MGIVRLSVDVCTTGHQVSRAYNLFLIISINGGVAVSGHILDIKGSLGAHIIYLQLFEVISSLQFYLCTALSRVSHSPPVSSS